MLAGKSWAHLVLLSTNQHSNNDVSASIQRPSHGHTVLVLGCLSVQYDFSEDCLLPANLSSWNVIIQRKWLLPLQRDIPFKRFVGWADTLSEHISTGIS